MGIVRKSHTFYTNMSDSSAATVRDVAADEYIAALAKGLKAKDFPVPKYADIIKTATHKELGPSDPDWYYIRAASVSRRVYLKKGLGVGALRRWYGGRARRGTKKNRYHYASSGLIRNILKSLEDMDFVKVVKANGERTNGRKITRRGQQFM